MQVMNPDDTLIGSLGRDRLQAGGGGGGSDPLDDSGKAEGIEIIDLGKGEGHDASSVVLDLTAVLDFMDDDALSNLRDDSHGVDNDAGRLQGGVGSALDICTHDAAAPKTDPEIDLMVMA